MFSDEGGGFWLAAQMIRLAIKEQDDLIEPSGILKMVLEFFGRNYVREVTDDFYNGKISRDAIASLAKRAHEAAAEGNQAIRGQISYGVGVLTESAARVAEKLEFQAKFPIAGIGGMFRAALMNKLDIIGNKIFHQNQLYQSFGAADEKLLVNCVSHTLFPSPYLKSFLWLIATAL